MADNKELQYRIRVNTIGQEQLKALTAQQKKFQDGVKRTTDEKKKLNTVTKNATKQMQGFGASLMAARSGLIALAGSIYGIKKAFGVFSDFRQRLSEVNTLVNMSAAEFKQLESTIVNMSKRIPQTASELTAAQYDIISAGVALKDSVNVLELSAKAAIAGVTDTKTAVTSGIGVVNAYGLEVDDLGRVYDVLFNTVKKGVITFPQLSAGLGQVMAGARQAGVDIEEVTSAIAALTKQQVPAARAFTALNSAIDKMRTPIGEGAKQLEDYGVQWEGLVPTLEKIKEVAGDDPEILKKMFPDREAYNAIAALTNGLDDLKDTLKSARDEVGQMGEAYDIMADTPENQIKLFKNEIAALTIELGGFVSKGLIPATKVMRQMSEILGDLTPATKALVGVMAGSTAAVGLWALGLGKVVGAFLLLPGMVWGAVTSIKALVGTAGTFSLASAGMAAAVGAIVTAFAALGAVAIVAALVKLNEWRAAAKEAARVQEELKNQTGAAVKEFEKFKDVKLPANLLGTTREQAAQLREELAKARAYWISLQIALQQQAQEKTMLGDLTDEAKKAAAQLPIATKRLNEVEEAIRKLNSEAQESKNIGALTVGIPDVATIKSAIEKEKALLTQRIADIESIAMEEKDSIKEISKETLNARIESSQKIAELLKGQLFVAKKAYKEESEEYADAIESMKAGANELSSVRQAALQQYQSALQKVQSEEKKWNDYLKGIDKEIYDIKLEKMSEYYRMIEETRRAEELIAEARSLAASENIQDQERAKELLEDARQLYKDNAKEVKENFGDEEKIIQTREQGLRKYEKGLTQIKEIAETLKKAQMDTWETQAANAESAFNKIDSAFKDLTTTMRTEIEGVFEPKTIEIKLEPSYDKLLEMFRTLGLPITKTVTVQTVETKAAGGVAGYPRKAGKIPGRGYKDDVPALLMRGEYVVKRAAVDHYGAAFLNALNQQVIPASMVPHFASGGFVDHVLDRKIEKVNNQLSSLQLRLANAQAYQGGVSQHFTGLMPQANIENIKASKNPAGALDVLTGLEKSMSKVKFNINTSLNDWISDAVNGGNMDVADLLKFEQKEIMALIDDLYNSIKSIVADFKSMVEETQKEEDELRKELAQQKKSLKEEMDLNILAEKEAQKQIKENLKIIEKENCEEMGRTGIKENDLFTHFQGKPLPETIRELPSKEQIEAQEKYAIIRHPNPHGMDSVSFLRIRDNLVVGTIKYTHGTEIRSGYIPTGNIVNDGRMVVENISGQFYHPRSPEVASTDLFKSEEAIKQFHVDHKDNLKEADKEFGENLSVVNEARKEKQKSTHEEVENTLHDYKKNIGFAEQNVKNEAAIAIKNLIDDINKLEQDRLDLKAEYEEAKKRWIAEEQRLKDQKGGASVNSGGTRSLKFFARGGKVNGPGGIDRVPSMLTAGEYVIKKPTVDALGTGFLNKLNNLSMPDFGESIRRFAEGGVVSEEPKAGLGTINLQVGKSVLPATVEKNIAQQFIRELKLAGMTI